MRTNLAARPALTGKANKIGYMPPPITPTKPPLIRVQVGQFRSPTITRKSHLMQSNLKNTKTFHVTGVGSSRKVS